MKKLLNSKWGIIGLVLCAVAAMLQSIALPIIQPYLSENTDSNDVIEGIIDPLLDDLSETLDQSLSSLTPTKSKIELSKLDWIENPRRNPFQAFPEPDKIITENREPEKQEPVTPPQLDAIIINDHVRYAILNTEIITIGETLGKFKIQAIQSNHVDLTGPEGSLRLHLIEPILEKDHETTK